MPHPQVEILEHQVCYQGFFRLDKYRLRHTLFGGGWSRPMLRELLERGHAVAVLPYDPVLDCVVMVEQFRIGALHAPHGAWLLEVVAGMMEDGEGAEDVARREAEEEAGLRLTDLLHLYSYHLSAGGASERTELFCGRVDAANAGGIFGLAEENEDIKVHVYPLAEALRLMESGAIRSATPIIALQWLALKRDWLRARWLGG